MTEDLAHAARQTRWAVAVAGIGCAIAAVWMLFLLDDHAYDDAVRVDRTVGLLVFVAGLFWLRWFRILFAPFRARRLTRFEEGWSLWAWVVPGADFVVPKMMVNDVWWTADGLRGEPPVARTPVPQQVQVWWFLWAATRVAMLASQWQDVDSDATGVFAVLNLAMLAVCAPFAVASVSLLTRRALRGSGAGEDGMLATTEGGP